MAARVSGYGESPLDTLMYWNGYQLFDPMQHTGLLSMPNYGVVNVGGKSYLFNAKTSNPHILDQLGSRGKKAQYDIGGLMGILSPSDQKIVSTVSKTSQPAVTSDTVDQAAPENSAGSYTQESQIQDLFKKLRKKGY